MKIFIVHGGEYSGFWIELFQYGAESHCCHFDDRDRKEFLSHGLIIKPTFNEIVDKMNNEFEQGNESKGFELARYYAENY